MKDYIDQHIIETRGWIERIVTDHNFKDLESLLNFINNKMVLDLGSGGGGFAVDHEAIKSVFPEYSGHIYSVNPRLPNPYHAEYDIYDIGFTNYRQLDSSKKVKDTQEILRSARKSYNKKAFSASWEALPFAEETFDVVFATGSYLFYEGTYSEESFEEILRVIKQKGSFYCSLFFSSQEQRAEFEKELERFKERHPSIERCEYEVISSRFEEKLQREVYSAHVIFHKF